MYELWLKLGSLAIPLLLCSIVASTVTIERVFFYFSLKKQDKLLEIKVNEILANPKLSKSQVEDEISVLLFEVNCTQNRGLQILQLISVISPMLGLLGTAVGIIKAFQNISTSQEPVSPALLADGLWQAILTTAVGISIAVFATLAYVVFKMLVGYRSNRYYVKANRLMIKNLNK